MAREPLVFLHSQRREQVRLSAPDQIEAQNVTIEKRNRTGAVPLTAKH